jgi:hypothetical protein
MQTLGSGYRGLSLLVGLNLDRLMVLAALSTALMLGSFVASLAAL